MQRYVRAGRGIGRKVGCALVETVLALAMLLGGPVAIAQSHHSAPSPFVETQPAETFRAAPGSLPARAIRLEAPATEAIAAAKRANAAATTKRLQIGIGRELALPAKAASAYPAWVDIGPGYAAHWRVTSAGAAALRVGLALRDLPPATEIRYAGLAGAATVYGPERAVSLPAHGAVHWSPVLEGDSALVEVFVPGTQAPAGAAVAIAQLSHLFAGPADPDVERLAKDGSQSCEVDLVCRSATDAAMAEAGKAVARMTFTEGGSTYLCTGTLLNPTDGSFIPYFYSAAHCIDTQAVASTLTTHWFYDRTGCGTGTTSASYRQLTGGATLLYANGASDALLLRLNGTPPAGAVYAGWSAETLATGTALTAIHHPAGDWKKVSLATMGGFQGGVPGGPSGSLIRANWNSVATGVTEGGSSGSAIFTATGSPPAEYRLRGGLYGGPSSCFASPANLYDYYSRFDLVYPSIKEYLDPVAACAYALTPAGENVPAQMAQGTFSVTTTAGCAWATASNAHWLTTTSLGSGSGTVAYRVEANLGNAVRTGTIAVANQAFTVTQAGANAAPRLVNLSTRARVLTGDDVMIAGFVIAGPSPKKVLVTARGPSLAAAGVTGVLPDPFLQLFSGPTQIDFNDDWGSRANASEIPATMRPPGAKESAILATLDPGAYTAIVTGVGSSTGIGLVEVFEVEQPDVPLANIATRGRVETDHGVMIAGLIIYGDEPKKVLVTARGPSLAAPPFNVPGTLADPVLQLYAGGTLVAENNDWETNANAGEIPASQRPKDAKEAALLVTLAPGAYTAIVTGRLGTTGVGIVEVFAQ